MEAESRARPELVEINVPGICPDVSDVDEERHLEAARHGNAPLGIADELHGAPDPDSAGVHGPARNSEVVGLEGVFFNDTATTEIYALSLHDALPTYGREPSRCRDGPRP